MFPYINHVYVLDHECIYMGSAVLGLSGVAHRVRRRSSRGAVRPNQRSQKCLQIPYGTCALVLSRLGKMISLVNSSFLFLLFRVAWSSWSVLNFYVLRHYKSGSTKTVEIIIRRCLMKALFHSCWYIRPSLASCALSHSFISFSVPPVTCSVCAHRNKRTNEQAGTAPSTTKQCV